MEQRAVIKFHVKIGKIASETFRMMQQAYGDACLSRSNVFIWHKRFVDGRESLEDEIKEGRSIAFRKPEMIQKVFRFSFFNRLHGLIALRDFYHSFADYLRPSLHTRKNYRIG